jgi:ABC-type branched-subunit amino acid transport system substrate-binding protein
LRRQDFKAKGVSGDIQFLPSGDRIPNPTTGDFVQVQLNGKNYQFFPIDFPP